MAFGGFQAPGTTDGTDTSQPQSTYTPPKGGLFGLHLPKLGLGNLLSEVPQIASGLVGLAEHPASRGPEMLRGAAAGTVGAFARLGNALTLHKLGVSNGEIDQAAGDVGGVGASNTTKQQLAQLGEGQWSKGVLPGLVGDVGSVALPFQAAHAVAALGDIGSVAEAGQAAESAAAHGISPEALATKTSMFDEASPLQKFASRLPLVNRVVPGAADLAGGPSALNAAARAASRAGITDTGSLLDAAKAGGVEEAAKEAASQADMDPEQVAQRANTLRLLHQLGHPYQSVFQDVIRPVTGAAQAGVLSKAADVADVTTNAPEHAADGGDKFRPITADELTPEAHTQTDEAGNVTPGTSRRVSAPEFQQIAQRGEDTLNKMADEGTPEVPEALTRSFETIKSDAYDAVQKSWGGKTYDASTGKEINPTKGLAVTIKSDGQDTISIPENASREEFSNAMDRAYQEFGPQLSYKGGHLGVFHDDGKGTIDIDPVAIVDTKAQAEELSAASHSTGGAYDYETGNGHFAPHVSDEVQPHTETDGLTHGTDDNEAANPEQNAPSIDSARTPGPKEAALDFQLNRSIPDWAQRVAAKAPAAVSNFLAKREAQFVEHDLKGVAREFARNMEAERLRTLKSPAMTEARAASQALIDDGITTSPAKAEEMVYNHLTRQLDGQSFIAHAAAAGVGDGFQQYLASVIDKGDAVPADVLEAHPDIAEHLGAAADQWRGLRDEAKQNLLTSSRKGSTGLGASLQPPEVQLTPRQTKEYQQILKDYQRATGMQPAVDKEAEAARKVIMQKDDALGKLTAKAQIYTEQAKQDAEAVLDQSAPKSMSSPEKRAAVAADVIQHTNDERHVMFDPASGKRVVFAKYATAEDLADDSVRVTPSVGEPGKVERYAVPITVKGVPLEQWAADATGEMQTFMEEHAAALAHPDVKIQTIADADGVHLMLSQSSINGRYLTMGQAHVLGMARGTADVFDMVDNDWHPPSDSLSGKVAASHVAEIMKPRSQFNLFLKGQEQTLNDLRAMGNTNIDAEAMRSQQQMFMNFATVQKGLSLDKFYGKLAVEARKTERGLGTDALFQINLNKPINMKTWNEVTKYLGPESDTALHWYNNQHDTIESQFRGKDIDLLDNNGAVKSVDMADLMYSLLAVTSVNASPLSNVGTALKGIASLVDYQKTGDWADKFRGGLKTYADAWDRRLEGAGASGQLSEKSPIAAEDLFKQLVGKPKVGMYTSVRADVLHVLSGNLLDDWTTQDIAKRFGRELPNLDTERASMEAGGSSAYAKIRSFHENLAHPDTSQGVTLDRVIAFAFGVPGGNWTGAQYTRVASAVRDFADQISTATGTKVLPHQVQAAIWVAAKDMANDIGRGRFLNDVSDTLDSIRNGTFTEKDNPLSVSIQHDIDLGPTKGIEDRQMTVRTGVKNDALERMNKLPKAKTITVHEQRQPGDIEALKKQLEVKYDARTGTRPTSWGAKAREIEANVKAGKTAEAEQILMGHANQVALHDFANQAENMDVFGPDAGSLRGVGAGTLGTVATLRSAGVLDPLPSDTLFQMGPEYEASHAAELQGLAAGADAEHGAATDTLKELAAPADDKLFQKYADNSVLGATYTKTQTGRLTMAFFKSADATTLVHEGAHVLRQFLTGDEVATLERAFGSTAGERDFEEKFADNFTSYLNGVPSPKMAGLAPLFAKVKTALATIWQGVQGHMVDQIDPNVASIIDKYLAPDEGSIGDVPDIPEFKADLTGKTSAQIAANLPKREGETQSESLRRGYLSGRAATQQAWNEEKAQRVLANKALVLKTRNELAQAITDRTLPKAAAMDRTLKSVAARADRLGKSIDANASVSQVPAEWQPMWQAVRSLQKAATEDPQIAAAMAGMPQTFTDVVKYATDHGFDPTHISSLSESDVKRLVNAPVMLGKRGRLGTEVEAGTRKARASVNYRTRSLEALAAAQIDVVWERETNNLIDVIEKNVAKPYVKDTPGWVPWDDQRGFLVTGEHTPRPEPTSMVPESVARGIKTMSGDYSHPVWQALGKSKIIHAWKALVMTWNPGHLTNVGLGQFVMSEVGAGAKLHDYVVALANMSSGRSDGDFSFAQRYFEKHGLGKLPESVDVNDLRGIGGNSEFAESTDGIRSGAMRELTRPPKQTMRASVAAAEGSVDMTKAVGADAKAKFARASDRLNNWNSALHRLGRAATYVASRRQGLSDVEAMNRAYEAMVDYGNLSPFERNVMTTVFPFYGFQKGLLKIMSRFPVDHPVVASLSMQLAQLNQMLTPGNLPGYYTGLAHLPGTSLSFSTKPVDPFQDAFGLVTPDGIAQAMNPAMREVFMQGFNGSDGFVENYRIDQFGNTVPDTSPAEDISSILTSSPEGSLLGSVADVGSGGGGRGVGAGLANAVGVKTYTPAQIAKLQARLQKSLQHTSGNMHVSWEQDAKPKPETGSLQ